MDALLLLHGAIGSAAQMQPLADLLPAKYRAQTINFFGHGGLPLAAAPFSIELFAQDILSLMQQKNWERISIFGYSMGGYVAMYLARHYPDKIDRVMTLATKYNWNEEIAANEVKMLNPEKIEQKLPEFASRLKKLHSPNNWHDVLKRTSDMMLALGAHPPLTADDYPLIASPSLLLLGDSDKMVTLEETAAVCNALPDARQAILKDTPHPIEQVRTGMLRNQIRDFLDRRIR